MSDKEKIKVNTFLAPECDCLKKKKHPQVFSFMDRLEH